MKQAKKRRKHFMDFIFDLPPAIAAKTKLTPADHLSMTVTHKAFVVTGAQLTPTELLNAAAMLRSISDHLRDRLSEACDCCVECGDCFDASDADDNEEQGYASPENLLGNLEDGMLQALLERDICLRDLMLLMESEVTIDV